MTRASIFLLGIMVKLGTSGAAFAWTNHGLITAEAVHPLAGVIPETVMVEPLDAFLGADPEGLAKMLDELEAQLAQTAPHVPPRPASLRFNPKAPDAASRRASFLGALRLHPGAKLALAIQSLERPEAPRPQLALGDVSLIPRSTPMPRPYFHALAPGEPVKTSLVLATASDEPDYGIDLGCFKDNGTEHGKIYGFGEQSFGNPAYEFSSQSPFHMAFHHERVILLKAAPFLTRTFTELRLAQDLALARFAIKSGHPYWGYRFAGWGLHYVQDLSQPYHAAVFPGRGTLSLLWVNFLDMVGMPKGKAEAVQIVNNRHLALENYVFTHLGPLLDGPEAAAQVDWAVVALRLAAADQGLPPWKAGYEREVITARSSAASNAVDAILVRYLPEKIVENPDYIFGETERAVSIARVLAEGPPAADRAMASETRALLELVGAHTRQYVRAALAP